MEPELILEDQIRECFGRVVYTHKTHSKMADQCAATLRSFKLAQMWIAALTSIGAVSLVFSDPFWVEIVTAGLALLGLMVSGYMKGFDPGGAAQKHRDAAATLWDIRESYQSLLTDLKNKQLDLSAATARRNELQALLAKVYKDVPQTNDKAYNAAQKALKDLEDYTFSDAEIDHFLPTSLKKNHPT